MSRQHRRIGLIGLGLNARHNYYPLLEQMHRAGGLELAVLVEHQSAQHDVAEFLSGRTLKPDNVVLCPDFPIDEALPRQVVDELSRIPLDGVIISVDPRLHRAYLRWAAVGGVDVLVDKPLTAREQDGRDDAARSLLRDYVELEQLFAASRCEATVMVTRRSHPGYRFVRDYLVDLLGQFGVPITFLDAYYGNGYWNMPAEFYTRENHPYRHGYGALLHAGYHVVDLFCWLAAINTDVLGTRRYDRLDLVSHHVTPHDLFAQVGPEVYQRLLGYRPHQPTPPDDGPGQPRLGETDVAMLLRMSQQGRCVTTGSITMLETSLSARAWRDLPADTYKNNGRLVHERITMNVGHLMAMHVQDYRHPPSAENDAGNGDNFVVQIFRNSRLIGGDAVAEHRFAPMDRQRPGGDAPTLAADGRQHIFESWVAGEPTGSPLRDHRLTAEVTAAAYLAMARQRRGRPPVATVCRSGTDDLNEYLR